MPAFVNVPPVRCFVRSEFFHDLQSHHGEREQVYLLGVRSLRGSSPLFTVLTERGAMWANVPLHALTHGPDGAKLPLPTLALWDCFSYDVECYQLAWVKGCRVEVRCGDGVWREGNYLWTLDWHGGDRDRDLSLAEVPHEHKTAHFVQLDCGAFSMMPNNRTLWREGSFVTDPISPENKPSYLVNTHAWSVEGDWRAEHSDAYFYSTTQDGADSSADPVKSE